MDDLVEKLCKETSIELARMDDIRCVAGKDVEVAHSEIIKNLFQALEAAMNCVRG